MEIEPTKGPNKALAAADLIHMGGSHRSTEIFVNPGKRTDPLELLMRTVFKNEKQAIAAVLLYSKCAKYGFQRGIDDLMALCAAKCSIDGRSTALALMAETGAVAPGVLEALSKGVGGTQKNMKRQQKHNRNDDG